MGVMTVRLGEEEERRLTELSKALRKDRSAIARDLLDQGWSFYWLNRYRQGKVSLEVLAGKLRLPLSDVIDLLAELRVEAPIDFSDYLAGIGILGRKPKNAAPRVSSAVRRAGRVNQAGRKRAGVAGDKS